MRALGLLLLLGACGAQPLPQNEVDPPAPEPQSVNAVRVEQNEAAPEPLDESGLADMSPSQRRAYRRGFEDCSAGRYDPDPYPEAYRIGCGAAEERR